MHANDIEGSGGIGPAVGGRQLWAVMGFGTASAILTAISPLLLGKMALEGAIRTDQIGQVATAEYLMLAIATAFAGAKFGVDRLRLKMAMTAVLFALANVASIKMQYPGILLTRMLAGGCEGLFLWLLMQMFARAAHPARLQGLYLGIEGLTGFLFSVAYSNKIIPLYGSTGGFLGLVLASVLLIPACLLLPKSFVPLPGATDGITKPTQRGMFGLIIVFLVVSGTISLWVHLPPLGTGQGQSVTTMGIAMPLALAMQIVGGLSAAALADRLPFRKALIGAWLAFIALALFWIMSPPSWAFIIFTGLFGFLWMFQLPFQISLMIDMDHSRRSLVFLPSAQPLGAAFGPGIASLAVIGVDVRGALIVSAGFFGISLLLLLVAGKTWLPRVAPAR